MLSIEQLWQLLLWSNTWQRSKISATFSFVLSILVLTIWFCLLEGTDREQLCQEYFQIRLLGLMQRQWAGRWLTRRLCQIFRECFGTSTRTRKGLSASKVIWADYRHSMKSKIKHKFCTYPTFPPQFRINFCSLTVSSGLSCRMTSTTTNMSRDHTFVHSTFLQTATGKGIAGHRPWYDRTSDEDVIVTKL